MSTFYLIALGAVFVAIVAALLEAVLSVSRKRPWSTTPQARLSLVPAVERRSQDLPFVGTDRRVGDAATHDEALEPQRRRA